MLNVGIIGLGNTGGQVAKLAKEMLAIPVMAINSSEKDLETIPADIPRKVISTKEGSSQGAGKDRTRAKQYLKESIMGVVSDEDMNSIMNDSDIVFVISSTGGGTGSGAAPMMTNILSDRYRDTKVILIGVLPVNNETLDAQVNTLEYLQELYKVLSDQTYMLYDNDKYSGLPSYQILRKVNQEIVKDIGVICCTYNYTTQYDSIDSRDMMRLVSFPGRIFISRLEDFSEKDADNQTIEDMLVDNIKRNAHVETQRDKKIMASGIITNLSKTLTEEFDNNVPEVRDFVGTPVHAFNHIYVNEDRKQPNNVFFIMSGLSPVNDKINLISDRIEEIEERRRIQEEEDALKSVALDKLSDVIADKEKEESEEVNLGNIFSKFGV